MTNAPKTATLTINISRATEMRQAQRFLADRCILSETLKLRRGAYSFVMYVPPHMNEESARRILLAATPSTRYIADWKDGTTA